MSKPGGDLPFTGVGWMILGILAAVLALVTGAALIAARRRSGSA